jgi:hypothetical protein
MRTNLASDIRKKWTTSLPSADFGWLVPTFEKLEFVKDLSLNGNLLSITRRELPTAVLALFSNSRLGFSHLKDLIESDESFDFILNTPREGLFMGDAIEFVESRPAGWGGVADAIRALRDCEDLSTYANRELTFVRQGLRQHSAVKEIKLLDSRRLELTRAELPKLVIYIDSKYQPTVDSIRSALEQFEPFDIYSSTNPNVGPTPEAIAFGNAAGVEVLRWGQTLGRIGR